MRILISHTNFPAQFRHIAEYLGKNPNNEVIFLTKNLRPEWNISGVKKAVFKSPNDNNSKIHPFSRGFELACRHGAEAMALCKKIKKKGFIPDVILGHSGWGQTLFLRDIFPESSFVGYFEWYYNSNSQELRFDKRVRSEEELALLRSRNSSILHDLVSCDLGITPTTWQRKQFPPEFQDKLTPVHDGINTRYFCPGKSTLNLPDVNLDGTEEIVTYCSRGLEPYRGFPQFYESLPKILEARPKCHVIIVGEDRVCYSPRLPDGKSYKELMTQKFKVDQNRVHFTGPLPYKQYKEVLQASSVHVYLTWPFVLSWSLLEAMSCGCLVVGSDTEPVREVIEHEHNGLLTDFHSPDAIARTVIEALTQKQKFDFLRINARETILELYCLSKCLPAYLSVIYRAGKT